MDYVLKLPKKTCTIRTCLPLKYPSGDRHDEGATESKGGTGCVNFLVFLAFYTRERLCCGLAAPGGSCNPGTCAGQLQPRGLEYI